MTGYQVFLSHASPDKPAVLKIAEQLRARGITLFLDEWHLIPGKPIQESLEEALDQSACCAVFIGANGPGPWQNEEMRSMLEDQVGGRDIRVIPVLLPGGKDIDIPRFLRRRSWVDFQAGSDDNNALECLIAGIEDRAPGPGKRRRSGEPGQLTIELRLQDGQLARRYLGPYGPLVDDRRTPWQSLQKAFRRWSQIGIGAIEDSELGQAIFDLLFRGEKSDFSRDVLAAVFDEQEVKPNPNRHPLRVRLHLNDPALANIPWGCLRWKGMSLADLFWSVELAIPGGDSMRWPERHEILHAPCPVLIVAPHQDRLDSARHVRAMQAKFEDLWPGSERPWVAVNGAEMDRAIQARRPRIVYFHGRAEQAEESLHLLLEGDEEALAPETLADYWKDHSPPQILFLNLVDDDLLHPNWAVQALACRIPLVIVQHWPQSDIQAARASALAWFEELLTNDDPHADPVGVLHDTGLCTAVAWAGYGSWRTEITDRRRSSARQPLTRLLLDRNDQRGKALQAMSELTRNRDRRMSCLLAYGGPGNMAAIFGQQIFGYLDQQTIGDSGIELKPLTLELPGRKSFGMSLVDRQIRENLGLGPKDSLKRALAQQKLDLPGNPMTVLLLDWQVRGLEKPGLKREALRRFPEKILPPPTLSVIPADAGI